MVCCDCEDDCQDKTKCACWQLSIQQTDAAPGMKGELYTTVYAQAYPPGGVKSHPPPCCSLYLY